MLLLRLSQGISSECHHATPTPKIFKFSLFCDVGIMLLLRPNQGISSGCHHAPLNPNFFIFSILVLLVVLDRDSPAALCFDLARVFLQGATMPPLHPRKKLFFLFLVPLVVWLAGALYPAKR